MTTEGLKIFCCYAFEDQSYLVPLRKHLAPLLHVRLIEIWSDADISPGANREYEVHKHLNTAQVILLLISSDFISSRYCYGEEMARAIERHDRGEATVIPILLRPVDLEGTPIASLRALPTNGKPITGWSNRDAAFTDVAKGIRKVIQEFNAASARND